MGSGPHKILPGGKTREDIAVEAIEKVWNGERDWGPLTLHLLVNRKLDKIV